MAALWLPPARPARRRADHRGLRAAPLLHHPVAPGRAGGGAMNLLVVGCSYRNTPVAVRERFAFDGDKLGRALDALNTRFGCEAVILSTCNRVELYVGQVLDGTAGPDLVAADDLVRFLAEFHALSAEEVRPHLYAHRQAD